METNDKIPDFFSLQVTEARRFYLNPSPDIQKPLVVVCGGCEQCHPEYQIHRETFPYYSIEFVAAGRGTVTLQQRNYELYSGCLFLYGPGISQHISNSSENPLIKYFIDFTGANAPSLLEEFHLPLGQVGQVYAPGEVLTYFDEIILNGLKATHLSSSLCVKLLECLIIKISETMVPSGQRESLAFNTFQNCRRHIQKNYVQLRNLEQIAEECHVNSAYLCRLFRRFDRQTPYQYLTNLKLNHAAELLLQPGALIKNIAEQTGFTDPFHFSRAFKTRFGKAPDIFRRQCGLSVRTDSP